MRHLPMIAVALLATHAASAAITFDEVPPNTDLDGLTIDGVLFDYIPSVTNPTSSAFAREFPVNGGNLGATDNFVASGIDDPDAELRLHFDQPLASFSFALSTLPFSTGRVFADVTLYDDSGAALDVQAFETDVLVRLLNGLPLLYYAQNLTLDLGGLPTDVRSVGMTFTGTSTWLMDNLEFTTVPAPSAAVLMFTAVATTMWRRRRNGSGRPT